MPPVDPNSLPKDIDVLHKIVLDLCEQLKHESSEKDKFRSLLRELLDAQRNRKSEQLSKDQLALFYGNWLHEGQILDPVMRNIESFFESTQTNVSGKVFVQLHPYRFQITGIESAFDLMSSQFGKYGEMNLGWTGDDVRGFSKIFGNQTMIYHQVSETAKHEAK